jgi:hypothetical protein
MEIRAGLVYSKFTGQLIGKNCTQVRSTDEIPGLARGPVAERDIDSVKEEDVEKGLAKKVMQLFWVSLDGSVAFPIGYYPTRGATANWMAGVFESVLATLRSYSKFSSIITSTEVMQGLNVSSAAAMGGLDVTVGTG